MHSTSMTAPTVQSIADTAASGAVASTSTEAVPVNHSNGPQCAHCGWRGGGHASNCPFSTPRALHSTFTLILIIIS
ncbi:hypothetical protein C8R44DRAFT_886530 [Mycena epipterygia]|nr:hypothetical protein C8R44DRAFT_886530 [Mycena epipterygia]